jgi:hypothetical protein
MEREDSPFASFPTAHRVRSFLFTRSTVAIDDDDFEIVSNDDKMKEA